MPCSVPNTAQGPQYRVTHANSIVSNVLFGSVFVRKILQTNLWRQNNILLLPLWIRTSDSICNARYLFHIKHFLARSLYLRRIAMSFTSSCTSSAQLANSSKIGIRVINSYSEETGSKSHNSQYMNLTTVDSLVCWPYSH